MTYEIINISLNEHQIVKTETKEVISSIHLIRVSEFQVSGCLNKKNSLFLKQGKLNMKGNRA